MNALNGNRHAETTLLTDWRIDWNEFNCYQLARIKHSTSCLQVAPVQTDTCVCWQLQVISITLPIEHPTNDDDFIAKVENLSLQWKGINNKCGYFTIDTKRNMYDKLITRFILQSTVDNPNYDCKWDWCLHHQQVWNCICNIFFTKMNRNYVRYQWTNRISGLVCCGLYLIAHI